MINCTILFDVVFTARVRRHCAVAALFALALVLGGGPASAGDFADPELTAAGATEPAALPATEPAAPARIPLVIPATIASTTLATIATTGWSLEQCLDYALAHHPDLIAARHAIVAAETGRGQVQATLKPHLDVRGSWSQQHVDARPTYSEAARALIDRTVDSYAGSLGYSQTILDWGRTRARLATVDTQIAAARARYQQQVIAVANAVKVAFYQVTQAAALEAVQREAVQGYAEHLDRARGLVETGSRPPYDITKAEYDLANSRMSLIRAQSTWQNALSRLARAIGATATLRIALPQDERTADATLPPTVALVERAFTLRPDLLIAQTTLAARERGLDEIKKSLQPSLSGQIQYNFSGTTAPPDRTWTAGMTLSKTVLDGKLQRHQLDEARANIDTAQAQLDSARLTARSGVETAVNAVTDARQRLATARTLIAQASDTLNLAEGRYDSGVGSAIEVTDARTQYVAARGELIQAIYDGHIALANLELAVGGPVADSPGAATEAATATASSSRCRRTSTP